MSDKIGDFRIFGNYKKRTKWKSLLEHIGFNRRIIGLKDVSIDFTILKH